MRTWSQRLIWIVLSVTILFFAARAYYRLTDDFRIANITYDLPYNSDWEVDPLTSVEKAKMRHILNQPYYYIGKGAQSYAFLSEDEKYVLKFFKFKHLKPNWLVQALPDISWFEQYKNKKNSRKKRLINSVFKGYKLAFDLHRKESGLLFIHLNKSSDGLGNGVLFDKIGRKHLLDLDATVFVVQENARTTRDVIRQALDAGDLALVNKRMDQIIDLYLLEYSKGIYDRDHGLMHNTGFVGDRPIHLDVGKLSIENNTMKKEFLIADLEKLGIRFEDWLRINYPQYHDLVISHIEAKMKEGTGEKVEFFLKSPAMIERTISKGRILLTHIANFIFPPACLHCGSLLNIQSKIFCPACLSLMNLINPQERCMRCFSSDIMHERGVCNSCIESPPIWHRAAAVLDYEGPAISLITAMKYGNQPHLAKGGAAFMAAQLSKLDWPFPDLIIPVPIPFTRWMQRGYNQSLLLAESLGKLIKAPIFNGLKRKSGDYSQAGLSSKQRRDLTSASFYLRNEKVLEDKIVLIIDDVMTTGSTLRCCAEVLLEGMPQNIYVLTVCRSLF